MPVKVSRCVSRIRRTMRRACARSWLTHHARSSNASGSNSKLLESVLELKSALTLLGREKSRFHRIGFQQIRGFPHRLDLSPKLDRHDNACRLTSLVGDDLDFRACHKSYF